MLAILNSLNGHNLPIFQLILMIHVSKFMVHRALSDKTYLSLGLLSPLIIGIKETWLSEEVKDSEIELANYDIFRCDRLESKGGGSLITVYNLLHVRIKTTLDSKFSVWRIIQLKNNDKLLVGVVYRSPPSSNINNDKLFQVFHNAASKQGVTHVMIMGDFNMPEIK